MGRKKLSKEEKQQRKLAKLKKEKERVKKWHLQENYRKCMKSITRGDIGEPTYFFNYGDRVSYGNLDYTKVIKVLEKGKLYLCVTISENIKYGKKVGISSSIGYFLWTEIRPYKTLEEKTINDSLIENDDIYFNYQQRRLSTILYSVYGGAGIDLNPDYQRELVWNESQKVALIDSIFKNVDIGKFTIIRRPFKEDLNHYYEVLDGKQRIRAILDFYECRFKYKGLTYNDLHWKDKIHFEQYNISYAETEPLTNEQKYRYFLKLNVSGVPMSKEHIEKVRKMYIKEKKEKEKDKIERSGECYE